MIGTIATVIAAVGISLCPPMDYDLPIYEDDPRFLCVEHGNRICGPNNDQGFIPGRYDEGGVLVETWDEMLKRCGRSDICLGA